MSEDPPVVPAASDSPGLLGLMLTEQRAIRRATEDLARSVTRYASLDVSRAFSTEGGFGAPPMRDGALLVHVSNLRDLVASSGVAGFFEGLFGGIGRFLGGLFGGLAGGVLGGLSLPFLVDRIDSILGRIQDIVARLGLGSGTRPGERARDHPEASIEGLSGEAQLAEWRDILSLATGLMEAASSPTGEPAPERLQASLTPQHSRWLSMLQSIEGIIASATRLVQGLTLLMPLLVGSLALLVQRLDALKVGVLDLFQFTLRNALLLRGVALVTVFDLLASSARLAAGVVGIVGETLRGVLIGLFDLSGTLLRGILAGLEFVAGGLQRTVNGMLRWLLDTLFVALAHLGNLPIFRLVTHLVRVMPAVLPPLYELLRGDDSPDLSGDQLQDLSDAARLTIPDAAVGSGSPPSRSLPDMPNLSDLLVPDSARQELGDRLGAMRDDLLSGVNDLTETTRTAFTALGDNFGTAVRNELERNRSEYGEHLATVGRRSTEFANVVATAADAAANRPDTGMEAIANAYEQWLTGQGFRDLLGQITEQLRRTDPSDTGSIPGQIAASTATERSASIDIDDVIIDLGPVEGGEPAALSPTPLADDQVEDLFERFIFYLRDQELRGRQVAPGNPF